MKTIGILGGIGPQATMDFEARLHREAQKVIPQDMNSGYPPTIVYYYRHPPILLTDGKPAEPFRADPRFLDAARKLGSMADFFVMTSNTPHIVSDEIRAATDCKLLSMVDLCIAEVQRRGLTRVGVLGFGYPHVYVQPLREAGIGYETIDGEIRAELDLAIRMTMEGRSTPDSSAAAVRAIADLRRRSVPAIILGCTEIPLLLGETAMQVETINPAALLARAAIEEAMKE